MMIRPLLDLTIRRLDRIFDPRGLPLVAKSSPDRHTTSILVRGGPGTGKTTLALALGQAIAADGGGVLLYLTTEFSPAEVRYKAEVLHIGEESGTVQALPDASATDSTQATEGTEGSVFVHHVSTGTSPEAPATSAEKKASILDAAWEALNINTDGEVAAIAGLPVRALVIDAFILPDHGKDDAELRTDLVAFIQALETAGVSAILVEEVVGDSTSWLPFVVDVVFILAHQNTGERHTERTLSCTKSRYGFVDAGPHRYGLSERVPALFPALRHAASIKALKNPLYFALPRSEDTWEVTGSSRIIAVSHTCSRFADLLAETPGAVVVEVDLHYPLEVFSPSGECVSIDESEGPLVFAWELLRAVADHSANLVLIRGIDRLLHHAERWCRGLEVMLLTLRNVGLAVVVLDTLDSLEPLGPIFDFKVKAAIGKNAGLQLRFVRSWDSVAFPPSPYILGLKWAEFWEGVDTPDFGSYTPKPKTTADDFLMKLGGGTEAESGVHGLEDASMHRAQHTRFFYDERQLRLAVERYELSNDWLVACAWVAGNEDAMDALEQAIDSDHRLAWVQDPLVRARTRWQGVEAAEACADRALQRSAEWTAQIPWLRDRVMAEIRIDREEPEQIDEGIAALEALIDSGRLPPVHEAEVHFNLALAHERRNALPRAHEVLRRALEINPHLAPARALAKRLQIDFGQQQLDY